MAKDSFLYIALQRSIPMQSCFYASYEKTGLRQQNALFSLLKTAAGPVNIVHCLLTAKKDRCSCSGPLISTGSAKL